MRSLVWHRISSLMNATRADRLAGARGEVGPSWSRDETMEQEPAYLVRYGLMGHVGRFPLDLGTRLDARIERGQTVVILTDRGVELGEVLVAPAGLARGSGSVGGVRSVVLAGSLIDTSKAELDEDPVVQGCCAVAVAADIQDARPFRRRCGPIASHFASESWTREAGPSTSSTWSRCSIRGTTVLHVLGPHGSQPGRYPL